MSKMGITKASLFFNCFLLLGSRHQETGSPRQQVAARGTSGLSLPAWQQHEKMPETSGYLVVCLHAGLQLMCSMMYTAAVVCIWCLPCTQECLISQLMKLLPLGLYNVATLRAECQVAERGVHIWTYPCRTNVSEGLIKTKIEKNYAISRRVCSQPRRFLPLCFPSCLPQIKLECSSTFPCGSLGAPAILPCLQSFLLNQVVKLVQINIFYLFLFWEKSGCVRVGFGFHFFFNLTSR